MDAKELKIYTDMLKKLERIRRENETPEEAMNAFEKYMKNCLNASDVGCAKDTDADV